MTSPDNDTPTTSSTNGEVQVDSGLLTKSQRATIRVLDAGILPHSAGERDRAYTLLGPAYNIQGSKLIGEKTARFHGSNVIVDLPPDISLAAQSGKGEHPLWKVLRERAIQESKDGVLTTLADHMMDYVEDAEKNTEALLYLDTAIEGFSKSQPLGVLLLDPRPEVQRAVTVLTRSYETQEYATQLAAKKSRMNRDLLRDFRDDTVQERIKGATHELTINEVRKEIIEALELEIGRLNFWIDQLVGHPNQPPERAEVDESDEFNRPAIRKRYGVIDIDNARVRNRILTRMIAIATGSELSKVGEEENEE